MTFGEIAAYSVWGFSLLALGKMMLTPRTGLALPAVQWAAATFLGIVLGILTGFVGGERAFGGSWVTASEPLLPALFLSLMGSLVLGVASVALRLNRTPMTHGGGPSTKRVLTYCGLVFLGVSTLGIAFTGIGGPRSDASEPSFTGDYYPNDGKVAEPFHPPKTPSVRVRSDR